MRRFALVFLVALFAPGCKKPVPVEPPATARMAPSPAPTLSPAAEEAVRQLVENFSRVHFAYDSSRLDPESRRILAVNAEILQRHPELRIEVQGHADERGTTDYNLALGMRRADMVRQTLTQLGVAPSRVQAISYGEERPLVQGQGETAWSQNRRAEFRVLTPSAAVRGTTGA